jgi:hypothetical protein
MSDWGPWHRRADIAARVVAAIPGGYAISYLFAGAVPLWLPMPRTEGVLGAALASFTVYTCVVLYAFGAGSVVRMWRNLALLMLVLAAAIWGQR